MASSIERIRSLSRKVKWLIGATALGLVVLGLYFFWLALGDTDAYRSLLVAGLPTEVGTTSVSASTLATISAIASLNAAVAMAGLWALWALFSHFERGEILSERTGLLLRRIGYLAAAASALNLVSRSASIFAATYNNPPGERMLVIQISGTDIGLLIIAGLVIILGHIIMLATVIDEENRSFV